MFTRRQFLATSSAAAIAALRQSRHSSRGYGPLRRDPDGIFDLPRGFRYRVISRQGEPMNDGLIVPSLFDGMGAFATNDHRVVLVRNHELLNGPDTEGPFGAGNTLLPRIDQQLIYDAGSPGTPCLGGTTTLVYNPRTQQVEHQCLSLVGTLRNCAGGRAGNSWLSCEEAVVTADRTNFLRDHGYVFLVPSEARELRKPAPLVAMGRFNHEAAVQDPRTGIVYLTEDRDDGLLYRFLPRDPNNLLSGGRLQALVVDHQPGADLRNWGPPLLAPGSVLTVHWIDLHQVDTPADDLRFRGRQAGAAIFARGEGLYLDRKGVYATATTGGTKRLGQVWRYQDASPVVGLGKLQLWLEPNDAAVMEFADNIASAPWGVIFACEDGPEPNRLLGIDPDGGVFEFGRNALNGSELTGVTFSADGTTLFVNIYWPGHTLAVTGPWR